LITLNRLKCGCLIKCDEEGGASWIKHPLCEVTEKRCDIDNYYKEHKPCLICGKCLKCFPHTNHNHIKYLPLKAYYIIQSFIFDCIVNISAFIHKLLNK
jgi:hypothetical protein